MTGPLSDIRVLDLTQVLSGPYCTMLLADMGADVLKVEPVTGDVARQWGPHPNTTESAVGAGYGGYFASINRNKRSACLDLTAPADRETLLRLVDEADVLVENFRVGVMDRFGLSYELLHDRNPRLVYASIRGFGDPRTGISPYADWPAFDIIAQAMGGIMSITGTDPANPVKVGPGVGDIYPAVLSCCGILAALHEVGRTGRGQLVDVAMYDSVLALTERIIYQHSMTGVSPEPQGNTHPLLCPYGLVRTADGFVAIAAPTDHHWRLLVGIMGTPHLAMDERFATNVRRVENASAVYQAIEAWSRELATDAVIQSLTGLVPCGPVNSAGDIARDPHVAARSMIVQVEHPSGGLIDIVGAPIKFSETPTVTFTPAPDLGSDRAQFTPRKDPRDHEP
ncbi:MAG: CaiB/BaiF CoA transferase family protein [Candidatus Nanopelagicales bacterium]